MRIIKLGNATPQKYLPQGPDEVGEVLVPDNDWEQDPQTEYITEIRVSPDSTLLQAVAEIKTIWAIHSKDDAPDWVSGTDAGLVALIADEFKCPIKEYAA